MSAGGKLVTASKHFGRDQTSGQFHSLDSCGLFARFISANETASYALASAVVTLSGFLSVSALDHFVFLSYSVYTLMMFIVTVEIRDDIKA